MRDKANQTSLTIGSGCAILARLILRGSPLVVAGSGELRSHSPAGNKDPEGLPVSGRHVGLDSTKGGASVGLSGDSYSHLFNQLHKRYDGENCRNESYDCRCDSRPHLSARGGVIADLFDIFNQLDAILIESHGQRPLVRVAVERVNYIARIQKCETRQEAVRKRRPDVKRKLCFLTCLAITSGAGY